MPETKVTVTDDKGTTVHRSTSELMTEEYVKRSYTKYQMIGYKVHCGVVKAAGKCKDIDRKGDAAYLPIPSDLSEDMTTRLRWLGNAVDQANRKLTSTGTSPSTLKIFMAPEFFFRPNTGLDNSYSKVEKEKLEAALKGMFLHENFRHWVFVCGTVIWNDNNKDYVKTLPDWIYMNLELKKNWVLNTGIFLKGGHPKAPYHTYNKVNYAGCDGVSEENNPLKEGSPLMKLNKEMTVKDMVNSLPVRKKSIVEVDDLYFGMEICKDHSPNFHVLKSTYNELKKDKTWLSPVPLDFHLVCSAGIDMSAPSVAARTNGNFLRVGASAKPYLEMRKVENQKYDDIEYIDKEGFSNIYNRRGNLLITEYWKTDERYTKLSETNLMDVKTSGVTVLEVNADYRTVYHNSIRPDQVVISPVTNIK